PGGPLLRGVPGGRGAPPPGGRAPARGGGAQPDPDRLPPRARADGGGHRGGGRRGGVRGADRGARGAGLGAAGHGGGGGGDPRPDRRGAGARGAGLPRAGRDGVPRRGRAPGEGERPARAHCREPARGGRRGGGAGGGPGGGRRARRAPARPGADRRRPPAGDGLRGARHGARRPGGDRRPRLRRGELPRLLGPASRGDPMTTDRTGAVVIAIDGPAASGKSSTAQAVARALGYAHLDSGALYRGLTLCALEGGQGSGRFDGAAILAEAGRRALELCPGETGFDLFLDGRTAEDRIRSAEVTANVSEVSALAPLRDWVNQRLRQVTRGVGGVVVDGRDIGTVVFPDAALK